MTDQEAMLQICRSLELEPQGRDAVGWPSETEYDVVCYPNRGKTIINMGCGGAVHQFDFDETGKATDHRIHTR